jgi:hypothetical protein
MAKEKSKIITTSSKSIFNPQGEKATFAFGAENYKMLLIGIAIVAIGMVCMISPPSEDPGKMSDTIFDFQRLTVAPILIIVGYIVVLLAILKKPKK